MRWVDGLGTRNGGLRSESIRWCGRLVLAFNPKTGDVGYRPRFCRDRACPACAKRRSRIASAQLRNMLEARKEDTKNPCGELFFATLTHPKLAADVESPGAAVSRLLAEWRKLTNRRGFVALVAGYVRAVEVTWTRSSGVAGWHAHLHVVIELDAKADQWAAWSYLKRNWCEIAGSSENAQDWQYLSKVSVHQLAKYITKPFQLPGESAVTFFREMAGRRIIEGSGTWRRWRLDDETQSTPMLEQRHTLTDLHVFAMKRETIYLSWRELKDGTLEAVGDVRPLREGERYHSARFDAIDLVERLRAREEKARADARPRDGPSASTPAAW